MRLSRRHVLLPLWLCLASCGPKLHQLPGAPTTIAIPRTIIPPGHYLMVFRWELEDPDLTARGEGAARVTTPDSVRLDFFLAGGLGSGAAALVGEDLRLPPLAVDFVRRLIPPPPLLWSTFGRLALPALRDTVVRLDGDTLRADIGRPVAWRLTFARDTLRRTERVDGGRVIEWVTRYSDGHVRYRNELTRRRLDLFITRSDSTRAFDSTIFQFR
jgi:hypothetical protein